MLDPHAPPLPDWFARRWHHCLVMLNHAAQEVLPPDRDRRLKARGIWLFLVVLDREVSLDHPSAQCQMTQGQAVLLPPDAGFTLRPGPHGVTIAKIHFLTSHADGGASPLMALCPPAIASLDSIGLEMVRKILAGSPFTGAQTIVGRNRLRPLLDAVLTEFAGRHLVGKSEPTPGQPNWLATVLTRLDRDFCKPDLNTATMAGWAGLSVWHFLREFRRHQGCTPAVWLRRQRVAKARALLTDRQCGLTETARSCGWRDAARLRRQIRAETGKDPEHTN